MRKTMSSLVLVIWLAVPGKTQSVCAPTAEDFPDFHVVAAGKLVAQSANSFQVNLAVKRKIATEFVRVSVIPNSRENEKLAQLVGLEVEILLAGKNEPALLRTFASNKWLALDGQMEAFDEVETATRATVKDRMIEYTLSNSSILITGNDCLLEFATYFLRVNGIVIVRPKIQTTS